MRHSAAFFNNIIKTMSLKPQIIEVDKDTFIKMMVNDGINQRRAEFHANISEAMNSSVLIGKQKVKIKKQITV